MTNAENNAVSKLPESSVGPSESCTLELSADGKWMRLIVGGKLTSAFHVEYVRKVLGETAKDSKKRPDRRPEAPVNL